MKNKGEREEIKKRKYKQRLESYRLLKDHPEALVNPRGESYNFTGYKESGKPCSCYICSKHKKYKRSKNKNKDYE
jgi:hypothetical protein